jgi:stage V sporulation protein SpoVS
MEVTPEMAGRMAGFEQMREEALASGDIQSAGAAALNTAADKLNMAADKMLESSKQTEALSFWDRARATLS